MSAAEEKKRPTAVAILGWLLIAVSALALLSSCGLFAVCLLISERAPGRFPPDLTDAPPGFGLLAWMLGHFAIVAGAQFAVSAFSIYAAVAFLRLRGWSRHYFEALSWLVLLYSVGFGVFWVCAWCGVTGGMQASAPPGGVPPAAFQLVGMVTGILATLINAAIPAFLIWLLRSRHVRPAFAPGARPEAQGR